MFDHFGFDNSSIGFRFLTFLKVKSWPRADSMAFSICHCKGHHCLYRELSDLLNCIFSKLLNVPASQIHKSQNGIEKFFSLNTLSCTANNTSNIY